MVRRNEIPWLFMGLIMLADDTLRAEDALNIEIRTRRKDRPGRKRMNGIRIVKQWIKNLREIPNEVSSLQYEFDNR